ncbi:MAG TPA: hypothetical protein VNO43_16840 [Candidatus Eisenbacteria bacterium]|nr:hypothetical protein [Candidatus Eisenbacteria bacterium]
MDLDAVEKIARAILYEGYLLYPYRYSAAKNRYRWNFGVLYPNDFVAQTAYESSRMQAECLIEASREATVRVRLRFLQLTYEVRAATGGTAEQAIEREVSGVEGRLVELAGGPVTFPFEFDAEPVGAEETWGGLDGTGRAPLRGKIDLAAAPLDAGLFKITVNARNLTRLRFVDPSQRESILPQCFLSTHMILEAVGGRFLSLMDPPSRCRQVARECQNIGAWPVLVGDDGDETHMLAAPIILYDYPEVAPESAGDLFDATEIDELLTLRILTLTEEEKEQMRRGDARARELLDRTEALSPEQRLKLHGAVRVGKHRRRRGSGP